MQFVYFQRLLSTFTEDQVMLKEGRVPEYPLILLEVLVLVTCQLELQ